MQTRNNRIDEHDERRLARNEALFRDANESIMRGQFPGEPEKVLRFRCECSHPDCGEAVEVTLDAYERVRTEPRRFIVAFEHATPAIEDVVETTERYLVVEKRGAAGEAVADATDPRR